MNKSLRIILISLGIIVFILAVGMGAWTLFGPKTEQGASFPNSVFDFFVGEDGVLGGLVNSDDSANEDQNGELSSDTENTAGLKKLRQVYQYPVSGATIITLQRTVPGNTQVSGQKSKTESITAVRIMERSSGNIFDIPLDTMTPTRVTNTTIPKHQEVFWNTSGNTLLARRVSGTGITVESMLLRMKKGSADVTGTPENENIGSLETVFSKENILAAASSPDGTRFFSLTETTLGSKGESFSFVDGTARQLTTSPLTEWLIEWPRTDTIYLSTKPSSGIPGNLYALNAEKGGALRKVIGGIPGMTAHMSGKGDTGLIGSATGTSIKLSLLSNGSLREEPLITFPEKCAWDKKDGVYCGVPDSFPPGTYPDTWYQGVAQLEDTIWYLDTTTDTTKLIASPLDYEVSSLDVINPILSSNGAYLVFINKYDMTPWVLEL
ncbi:MAG: hypothetical protein HGA67_01205 [Candidatus Yonathbacteria bacterium]|nr:hypothetical protein [Candidatus Yonathbacteria bacterium]